MGCVYITVVLETETGFNMMGRWEARAKRAGTGHIKGIREIKTRKVTSERQICSRSGDQTCVHIKAGTTMSEAGEE